jgi:pantoate--beta-alanine ligase
VFVNPTQFGPNEDFTRYPRTPEADMSGLEGAGCDVLWLPTVESMYPFGVELAANVHVPGVSGVLEGAHRLGHFDGVCTVVSRLFNQVQPDVAAFGKKDYQQLAVIRRMTRDLDFGIEIVGVPIVREPDGLAMSSRNVYLSPAQRAQALALVNGLGAAEAALRAGERDAAALLAAARAPIEAAAADGGVRIDYLELRDADDLSPVAVVTRPAVLAMAVFVGTTRLIDNRVLKP